MSRSCSGVIAASRSRLLVATRRQQTRRIIGPVYTPPICACRGFAQAVTAAASVHVQRDRPRSRVLFTDALNPPATAATSASATVISPITRICCSTGAPPPTVHRRPAPVRQSTFNLSPLNAGFRAAKYQTRLRPKSAVKAFAAAFSACITVSSSRPRPAAFFGFDQHRKSTRLKSPQCYNVELCFISVFRFSRLDRLCGLPIAVAATWRRLASPVAIILENQ